MRLAARVDQNQSRVFAELRTLGFSVLDMSKLGKGAPDFSLGGICPIAGTKRCWMFELKNPEQPKSKRKLTPKEQAFSDSWRGQYDVVESAADVLRVINFKSGKKIKEGHGR